MSVASSEEPEVIELPPAGDAAFATLMDTLVAAEEYATTGALGDKTPAATGGDGQSAADDQGAPTAGAESGAPGAGAPDVQGVQGGGTPGTSGVSDPAGEIPATWTVDADSLTPAWGELSQAIEKETAEVLQRAAYAEVREEYGNYFDALEKHPRLLVGQTVPAVGKEGTETLRDSTDAAEWQEAIKSALTAEVRDRATRNAEDQAEHMERLHASIELFQNNNDLVPGTKQFNRKLADRFTKMAKPYELRVDGKLTGYTIPVQPLIDSIREDLKNAPAPAPAAAAPAAKAAPKAPARQAEPPQAGIPAKAGQSSDVEDFSALFGTIGLPNFRI